MHYASSHFFMKMPIYLPIMTEGRNMGGKYDEKLCCCALNSIFGFEPKVSGALLDSLGSASAVFELDREGKDSVFGPYSRYAGKISLQALEEAEKELSFAEKAGACFVGRTDSRYPALLKECPDAPAGLYVKSSLAPEEIFAGPDMVAVVGTRDVSVYGKEWTCRLVDAMSRAEVRPAVVSGLAIGVDIAAHRAALDCGMKTVAVMATGIDSVYPSRHAHAAEEIASTGALVTDFPPGTSPLKVNFIRRNRIIAGMSRAAILVESRIRGGGMVTANLAFSYGRELYALPGRADDVRSQGCNWLIRAKMAEPVFSSEDLVKSLGLGTLASKPCYDPESAVRKAFSGRMDESRIKLLADLLSAIRKHRGITIDELASKTSSSWRLTRECISLLECDGLISVDLLQRCTVNVS